VQQIRSNHQGIKDQSLSETAPDTSVGPPSAFDKVSFDENPFSFLSVELANGGQIVVTIQADWVAKIQDSNFERPQIQYCEAIEQGPKRWMPCPLVRDLLKRYILCISMPTPTWKTRRGDCKSKSSIKEKYFRC
jgi:hypothetical protein